EQLKVFETTLRDMSRAANPNKPKKTQIEIEADVAAKKQEADRERIKRCIITLGDENKKVVSQIRGAVQLLQDDVELHGELMSTVLIDCAKCLPIKLGIYAAWCAKMAEKHPKWAANMVSCAMEELRARVQDGSVASTQLLLRFIVFLANTGVLGVVAVLDLLLQVISVCQSMQLSRRGDFPVFMALASLPFLSPEAYRQGREKVDSLIAAACKHAANREAAWKSTLRIFKSKDSFDRLEELLRSVKQLSKQGWSLQVVLHVPGFQPSALGINGMPEIPLGIAAEDFQESCARFQVPLMSVSLLTSESSSGMALADRWVLEDYLLLVVEMFAQDIEECSKQILRIPVLHYDFEAITVEILFSQLLRLPTPVRLPLFYCRVLEACAEKQSTMRKLIQEAFQSLFCKLSDMDEDCIDVLAEAFACHLAGNGYQADWSIFVAEDANVQVLRFAQRALERLQRLSEHQNMMARLPQAMRIHAPPEPLPASGLQVVSKPQFGRLINLVRLKDSNAEKVLRYCKWLMHAEEAVGVQELKDEQEDEPHPKRQKIEIEEEFGERPSQPMGFEEVADLVVSVMLQQGHKTPTHMAKILDGHDQVLHKLKPSKEEDASSYEKAVARSVLEFWKAAGQRLEITFDSLIQRKVISPQVVAETALCHGSLKADAMPLWNVVGNAARKSLERSQAAHADLAIAKKLQKEDVLLQKCQAELECAIQANARLFLSIFTSLVNAYEDAERDAALRNILLCRIVSVGRKYLAEIRPLIKDAESRIPHVGRNPDIAAVFKLLNTL
ncbi:unnamed protein product, partial [Durusdinium trenchii]